MSVRDSERQQVYAAEDLSAENTILTDSKSLRELQVLVDDLLRSTWWRSHCDVPSLAIAVEINRSRQRSRWLPSRRLISISPVAMDLNTLLHELAHAAATDFAPMATVEGRMPVHGCRFRGLHVGVRHAVLGQRCGDDLAEVYRQFGLTVLAPQPLGTDAWSNPVLGAMRYEAEFIIDPLRPPDVNPMEKCSRPIAL